MADFKNTELSPRRQDRQDKDVTRIFTWRALRLGDSNVFSVIQQPMPLAKTPGPPRKDVYRVFPWRSLRLGESKVFLGETATHIAHQGAEADKKRGLSGVPLALFASWREHSVTLAHHAVVGRCERNSAQGPYT